MKLAVHKYIRGAAVQKKPCPLSLKKCKFLFVGEKDSGISVLKRKRICTLHYIFAHRSIKAGPG